MGVSGARRHRLGRSPGFVNLAAAAILTLLVTIIALRASPASPPEIAEFAPTAHQQILQAPPDQSVVQGKGPGVGGPGGTPTPTPTPTPAPSNAALPPATHPCVGNPPLQIEDPQSPLCVPFWTGNNGGATYPGVTGSEITVAVPTANGAVPQYMQDLAAFFNRRFEMYNRSIHLVGFTDPGNHADAPPDSAYQAEATQVQQQIHAFASTNMTDSGGGEIVYYDDLAKEGIISVANENVIREGESHTDAFAPYEWRTYPGFDVVATTFGQYVCSALNGQPASHAGAGLSTMTRKFGILMTTFTDGFQPDISPLTRELSSCGINNPLVIPEKYDINQCENCFAQDTQQDMLKFKESNVTSILCVCHGAPLWLGDMPAAQNQAYFPEWVYSGYQIADWDTNTQAFGSADKQELAGMFGLSFNNKYLVEDQEPVIWAIHTVDPSYTPSTADAQNFARDYQGFLVLASGIQEAGPDLTPQSFQAGLFKQGIFPDPGADRAPYFQNEVGFNPSHSFFHSEAEIWWSNSATSTWGNNGAFCWARHGQRFPQEQWPAGPSFAGQGSCY